MIGPRTVALLGLAGCTLGLPPLADGPRLVQAEAALFATVPAVMPSDVDVLPDGSIAVLDGYAGRVFRWSATGEALPTLEGPGFRGGVRLQPVANGEGFWITVPDLGVLRRVLPDGTVHGRAEIDGVVDVLDRGSELIVGLREGGLAWLDPKTGAVLAEAANDVDGQPLGTIGALIDGPGGSVLAVDTMGKKVHRFDAADLPRDWIGHYGMWVGSMSQPKAIAEGPDDTLIIADSALRSIQLFERDGQPLGAVATVDGIFQPEHPIQVVMVGQRALVLDAIGRTVEEPAELWSVEFGSTAIADARAAEDIRHMRQPLSDPDSVKRAAGEERLCRQCHDGIVNDDRDVWDPALRHHPTNLVPDRAIPPFFPTDADGAIRCGTCHSPHGTVELEAARGVDAEPARANLVRHVPADADLFTRLSRTQATMCRGCHEDAAHDQAVDALGLEGGAHPVGPDLAAALAKRGYRAGIDEVVAGADGNCLACHAPHGASRPKLIRDTAEGATCASCHTSATGRRAHPLTGRRPAAKASAELPVGPEGGPTCITCHSLVGGVGDALIRMPADGTALCRACHEDGPAKGGHRRVKDDCLGCHAPHEAARADGLLARVGPSNDPLACRECHKKKGVGQGHPIGAAEGDATCTTCHGIHETGSVTGDCASCHEQPAAAAARGGHGGLGCIDCHAPHRADKLATAQTDPRSRHCLSCHGPGGDAKRVKTWSHDASVFAGEGTRWEPLQGLLLVRPDGTQAAPRQGGDLACVSCHTVHGPHESDPGDSLRRPGWEEPCAACHGSNARRMYRWFHDEKRRKEDAR